MSATLKREMRGRVHEFATVNDKVKSYAEDPFFVKKAEHARETIKKFGLPGTKKK